jgi:Domain of unknown function (DUF4337)
MIGGLQQQAVRPFILLESLRSPPGFHRPAVESLTIRLPSTFTTTGCRTLPDALLIQREVVQTAMVEVHAHIEVPAGWRLWRPARMAAVRSAAPAWLRYLPLSTAMIAVFATVASLLSGSNSNEAILEKSDAMLNQSVASDKWAYYQAKSVKQKLSADEASILELAREAVKDLRPEVQARFDALKTEFDAEAQRYDGEAKPLFEAAHEFEHKVEESNKHSAALMERHHKFAFSVTLLQIAIALSAIAALTRRQPLWYLGLAVSIGGILKFVLGWMSAAG